MSRQLCFAPVAASSSRGRQRRSLPSPYRLCSLFGGPCLCLGGTKALLRHISEIFGLDFGFLCGLAACKAHVSVFRGGIFIGQRLGVYQCDGLLDLFLCFLTALVSSGWWRMVDSGGQFKFVQR
ncbi:hypothetical protein HID58_024974 [Brassica napus]|uniref:Uncharacterized protein n=1 Tax=Brassica napus TaxID=3708 RepID=A0ABQ8CJP9_BRANA|nr:hypothetical protein HID58_024974 [Brassica napus]